MLEQGIKKKKNARQNMTSHPVLRHPCGIHLLATENVFFCRWHVEMLYPEIPPMKGSSIEHSPSHCEGQMLILSTKKPRSFSKKMTRVKWSTPHLPSIFIPFVSLTAPCSLLRCWVARDLGCQACYETSACSWVTFGAPRVGWWIAEHVFSPIFSKNIITSASVDDFCMMGTERY